MRPFFILFTILAFILVIDLYAYRGVINMVTPLTGPTRVLPLFFWGVTAIMIGSLVYVAFIFRKMRDPSHFFGAMVVMGIFLMLYLPKLVFNAGQLLGDLFYLVTRIVNVNVDTATFRLYFLIPAALLGLSLFIALGAGMVHGRTNVKIFREEISIPGLPEGFANLKLVQLSDFHLAGFHNDPGHISRVVRIVNDLEPDLILFTGDMVHNFSEEVDPFIDILQQLNAPLGKFAILGNHDYGHYYNWSSPAEKKQNIENVKSRIRETGFDLLLNEHRIITRNGDSISIIGIENWGKQPFPQYGNLARATDGLDMSLTSILLSHDPSHWELQVNGKYDIELTLSGHTHGMQLGFEIGRFRWSPSRWQYRNWAGLYSDNGQYLYVNRGIGFTGFPGRVGIRPEITLIKLKN